MSTALQSTSTNSMLISLVWRIMKLGSAGNDDTEDRGIIRLDYVNDLNSAQFAFGYSNNSNTTRILQNGALIIKNTNLTTELEKVYTSYEEQNRRIHDLTQEVEYLRTYTQAVEGVAENYCGQTITTENKYQQLKRQSTMLLSKLVDQAEIFNFEDLNDATDMTDGGNIPTPIFEMTEIKRNHRQLLEKEKERYEELRQENIQTRSKVASLSAKNDELHLDLEDRQTEVSRLNNEMKMLTATYVNLKEDHERMLNLFSPIFQLKSENQDLKRTSAILLGSMENDDKVMEFIKIVNELKSEIQQKDQKILDLTKEIDDHNFSSVMIEMTELKAELEETTNKLTILKKDNEKLNHENRILSEQRTSFGTVPPPPPMLPPPPPSSGILGIFKKGNKNVSGKTNIPSKKNPENQLVCDLMHELELKLKQKVINRMKDEGKSKSTVKPPKDDVDSAVISPTVLLRSKSVPTIVTTQKEDTDLQNILKKFNICALNENE